MAKGSQTGWFGLDPSKRFCAYPPCGRKITLAPVKGHPGPYSDWHLWHESYPERRVFHSACALQHFASRRDPAGRDKPLKAAG